MSSEGDNAKNLSSEVDEKKEKESVDAAPTKDENEGKVEKDVKEDGKEDGDKGVEKKVASKDDEKEKENEVKKDDVKEKADEDGEKEEKKKIEDEGDGDGSDKEEGSDEEEDKKDSEEQSEKSGGRNKKKAQPVEDEADSKDGKTEIPSGSGSQLGEIPRIDASISRFKNDDLKLLHRLLFKAPGKTTVIKKNIKKFNGFEFKKDSDEYEKKVAAAQKFEVKQLKSICEMLDLEKKGNKEEIVERIIDFLLEPKDSGKADGGGRPKRTAAVRANNRGYSSHDDSYSSDERHTPRARRDKGKRANLKDDSSSESDEDFHPSDVSDEEKPRGKGRRGRKKAMSDDEADLTESDSEDSDDEPKNKKKKGANKLANNKPRGRPPAASKGSSGRGRKPAPPSAKKAAPTPKRGRKRKETSSEEEENEQKKEDGSSSEDEPLAKKTKAAQPPTDDEIKTYVKEILDGANLEEITMKTVCKQVYAHYPDFDLAHKKDFIKSTVKSLIST